MVFGSGKFQNGLIVHYGFRSADLQTHCDGYQKNFSLTHVLDYNLGELVMGYHNEVPNELTRVLAQAYFKLIVCIKPYITAGQDHNGKNEDEDSPVIVFRTSCNKEADGEAFGNTGTENKKKYLKVCTEQQKDFT
eukprot:267738-Ditylum_brightwellii.AAC.1